MLGTAVSAFNTRLIYIYISVKSQVIKKLNTFWVSSLPAKSDKPEASISYLNKTPLINKAVDLKHYVSTKINIYSVSFTPKINDQYLQTHI